MFKFAYRACAYAVHPPHLSHLNYVSHLSLGLMLMLAISLAACGGGGGGGSNSSANVSARNTSGTTNVAAPTSPDYSVGMTSSEEAAIGSLFLGAQKAQPYVSSRGTQYSSLGYAQARLNANKPLPIASLDTKAWHQWRLGWTGKGIDIAVLDAFSNNDVLDTHGERVALVANSVAPEANIVSYHFDYSTSAAERAWETMSARGHFVVNNSFARPRYSQAGVEDTGFDSNVRSWVNARHKATGPARYDKRMVFVFAAGNSGHKCPARHIDACTFRAAVTHKLRQAGQKDEDAMIWVGALNDAGTQLASYSHSAGAMKNDFIVAHDNVLGPHDASGTSYAAPRVSGAAALIRQKFPRLDGFSVKDILLDTATDMGAEGVDEIFGHGRLDLSNALSPQGRLSASFQSSSLAQ